MEIGKTTAKAIQNSSSDVTDMSVVCNTAYACLHVQCPSPAVVQSQGVGTVRSHNQRQQTPSR